ncbi:hypothetical protein B5P44_00990 [Mycobacterium sp. CBMA 213]|uniref:Uncharacterized protein n=1 Tax=Mycolicibacterium sp. CBMA 213 TaxID=1968788 RepID=A0A343VRI9_9MYCO|nr:MULTISPECIES: cellulase family glycosylhydrolase [unclassified Mycolicibacterium]AVN58513.1 hypothetical protein B5P44_p00218 [Mycolicibacterium sp. CBMA 213]MUL61158.1 glycoside hydrolase family 5 protein [Mycolicibacterium sp. CBMA 335]MUM03396.1 hypothetical protein [Mycolicibacterium sp. CBMA 213]
MTTALLRAKMAVATSVLALSALSPADQPHPPAPLSAAPASSPRTVSMAVELAASIGSDGSSQTVGVADAYLYTLSQTDLVAQLNEIHGLGVTDLRIVVPWIYIQPTSAASYDWTKMDNVVNTARSMGFTMTASITMNPTWDGTPLVGTPNPNAYANFAAAVAQRYGSSIGAYEIWNEPNAVTFLAPSDPGAYTAMLKAAYTAIKAVAPSATVIAGVLGAVTTVPGMSLAPQQFLAGMYAAGAQGFFDALSFHPYNYTLPFSAGSGVTNSPLEQVKALYALMAANGDSALKIWATEYGTATTPGGISQTQQAQMLRDFVTAWSKLSFAGPAFVYTANDLNSGYLLDDNNFGLFTTSGIPKLAAQTLATLISQLASGTLPNFTAPQMSAPQTIWIQLVSTAIAVINMALFVPNFAVQVAYNAAPAALQQVFSAVARAVSMSAAQTLNAITPAAQTGIGMLVNFPTSVQAAASALGGSFYGTELTVARALASIGIGAVPNPAPTTAATATSTSAIATAPTAVKAAVAAIAEPTSKATYPGTTTTTAESTTSATSAGPAPEAATKVTPTSTDTTGATTLPSPKTTTTASAATTSVQATASSVDGTASQQTATATPAAKTAASTTAKTPSATAPVPTKATATDTTSTRVAQQATGAQEASKPAVKATTKTGARTSEKTGGEEARHAGERTSAAHAATEARS